MRNPLREALLNLAREAADKQNVKHGRREERIECAQLVHVVFRDGAGRKRKLPAVLEDISPGGACVMLEEALAPETPVSLLYPSGRYHGRVRYCEQQPAGYFTGVEFDSGYRWSKRQFKPEHLLQLKQRDGEE